MITIVADTNIYISSILFGGKPEKIRTLAQEDKIQVLISEAILAEITDILSRKFNLSNWQISHIIDELRSITTLVAPKQTLAVIKEDEPDNRILECALAGEAQYIISGDKHHLLPLKIYHGIKIVSPSEFLKIIQEIKRS